MSIIPDPPYIQPGQEPPAPPAQPLLPSALRDMTATMVWHRTHRNSGSPNEAEFLENEFDPYTVPTPYQQPNTASPAGPVGAGTPPACDDDSLWIERPI
jgi:hypothetical protein